MVDLVRLSIVLSLLLSVGTQGSQSTIIKLSRWLDDFQSCSLSVIRLAADVFLDSTSLDIPVTQHEYSDKLIYTNYSTSVPGVHTHRIFCGVQIFLLTDPAEFRRNDTALRNSLRQILSPDPHCSSSISKSAEYKWTHCLTLMAGLAEGAWKDFLANEKANFQATFSVPNIREHHEGLKEIQYFVFFGQEASPLPETTEATIEITGIDFLCRICNFSDVFPTFPVPSSSPSSCRRNMEETVNFGTGGGRSIGFTVISEADGSGVEWLPFLLPSSPLEKDAFLTRLGPAQLYLTHAHDTSITQMIQAILFQPVPENVSTIFLSLKLARVFTHDIGRIGGARSILYRKFRGGSGASRRSKIRLYLSSRDSYNFVTCYGMGKSIPIRVWLKPFDSATWVLIGSILVLACILLISGVHLLLRLDLTPDLLSTTWFYAVSMLLDNGFGDPWFLFQDKMKITFRAVCTIFILMSLILGNSYKGIITRDIISPIPNTIEFQRILELEAFTIALLPAESYVRSLNNNTMYYVSYMMRLAEERPETYYLAAGSNYSPLGEVLSLIIDEMEMADREDESYVYRELFNRTRIFAYPAQVLDYLSDCEERRAFAGSISQVEGLMRLAASAEETFVAGQDAFLPVNNYWHVPYGIGSFFHRRMAQIIDSGIYGMWEEVYNSKQRGQLVEPAVIEKQGLDTNLGALFKLLLTGYVCGVVILLLELGSFYMGRAWVRFRPRPKYNFTLIP